MSHNDILWNIKCHTFRCVIMILSIWYYHHHKYYSISLTPGLNFLNNVKKMIYIFILEIHLVWLTRWVVMTKIESVIWLYIWSYFCHIHVQVYLIITLSLGSIEKGGTKHHKTPQTTTKHHKPLHKTPQTNTNHFIAQADHKLVIHVQNWTWEKNAVGGVEGWRNDRSALKKIHGFC